MSISPTAGSSSVPSSQKPGGLGKRQVDIITIPAKFYGMALTMDGMTQAERDLPSSPPPPPKPTVTMVKPQSRQAPWAFIVVILLLVISVGGVFGYVNRDLLFRKPVPVVAVAIVPQKSPPAIPTNLSATSSGGVVALAWVDGGGEASGVRIERQSVEGGFVALTVLPAGSSAFLDVSAESSHRYTYRVIAFGEGGESLPSNEALVQTPFPPALPPPPPPAPTLPPGGLDSDSDGLTDIEEPLYGTDARNPDADADGFLDGNEVFHLYNPAATSPVRLLDSGLVKLFTAPAGWSLLVPVGWITGLDVPDGSQATVTTGHGESITLYIEDNATTSSLADWYMARTPGENASSVHPFVTKGGLQGVTVSDRLEALFPWGTKVFRMKYQTGGQPFINYRTTFEMMMNSLKLVGVPLVALPATFLPVASSSTASVLSLVSASSTITVSGTTQLVPVTVSSTVPALQQSSSTRP